MDVALAALMGLVMGWGVGQSHPSVSAGLWINLLAGAVGGLAGRALWADAFTEPLADSYLAAVAAAGALGGAVLVIVAAIVRHIVARQGR